MIFTIILVSALSYVSSIEDFPSYRSSIMYDGKPILRLGPDLGEEHVQQPKEPKEPEEPEEAFWLIYLKNYIQSLVQEYGEQPLDEHLGPVIKFLEQFNIVLITDIDVDKEGEIQIKFVIKNGLPDFEE